MKHFAKLDTVLDSEAEQIGVQNPEKLEDAQILTDQQIRILCRSYGVDPAVIPTDPTTGAIVDHDLLEVYSMYRLTINLFLVYMKAMGDDSYKDTIAFYEKQLKEVIPKVTKESIVDGLTTEEGAYVGSCAKY